jgi:hypothetical protein
MEKRSSNLSSNHSFSLPRGNYVTSSCANSRNSATVHFKRNLYNLAPVVSSVLTHCQDFSPDCQQKFSPNQHSLVNNRAENKLERERKVLWNIVTCKTPTLSLATLRNQGESDPASGFLHPNKRKATSMLSHFPLGWALPGSLTQGEVLPNMTHLLAHERD